MFTLPAATSLKTSRAIFPLVAVEVMAPVVSAVLIPGACLSRSGGPPPLRPSAHPRPSQTWPHTALLLGSGSVARQLSHRHLQEPRRARLAGHRVLPDQRCGPQAQGHGES